MAVTELCPVEYLGEESDKKKSSIKGNAYDFMQNGESELDPISPDSVPLPRLKLEVDSMVAIILNHLKGRMFSQETQDLVVGNIDRADYSHRGELLDRGGEEALYRTGYIFDALYKELQTSEGGQELLERTDHYRGAYFRSSPIPGQEEKIYASTKQLVWAGLNTLGHQGTRTIYAIESSAILAKMDVEERIALAKDSGHMAVLLSKLSLPDLGRYINALNNYEEVLYAVAKLKEDDSKTVAYLDKRILEFMRQVDGKDMSRFNHREHTGCVGSVDLDGTGSPVKQGWVWLVEVMERAGYWDESWIEAALKQKSTA